MADEQIDRIRALIDGLGVPAVGDAVDQGQQNPMGTQVVAVIRGLREIITNLERQRAAALARAAAVEAAQAAAGEEGRAAELEAARAAAELEAARIGVLEAQIAEYNQLVEQLRAYIQFYSTVMTGIRSIYDEVGQGQAQADTVNGLVKKLFEEKAPAIIHVGGYKKQYGGENGTVKTNSLFKENLNKLNSKNTITQNNITTLFNKAYKISKNSPNSSNVFIKLSGNIGKKLSNKSIKNKLEEGQTLTIAYFKNIINKVTKVKNIQPVGTNPNISSETVVTNANQLISQLKANITALKNLTGIKLNNTNSKITLTNNIKSKFKSINSRVKNNPNKINKINKNVMKNYLNLQLKIKEAEAEANQSGGKKKRSIKKKKVVKK